MITDLARTEYLADVAIYNSGTFRKNEVMPAGPISLLQISESFPFNDAVMVLKMSGQILLEAMQWAISKYPSEEG